jgi:hypothetical protein
LSVVFFTDRDLGLQFPRTLREAGLTVERHADHFPPNSPDTTWLSQVSKRGWVALTHDRRIRYKPNELAAVVQHQAALLVVVGQASHLDLARSFIRTVPRILVFLGRHERPLIAKVYRPSPAELMGNPAAPGRIELWYPTRPLKPPRRTGRKA